MAGSRREGRFELGAVGETTVVVTGERALAVGLFSGEEKSHLSTAVTTAAGRLSTWTALTAGTVRICWRCLTFPIFHPAPHGRCGWNPLAHGSHPLPL